MRPRNIQLWNIVDSLRGCLFSGLAEATGPGCKVAQTLVRVGPLKPALVWEWEENKTMVRNFHSNMLK